MKKSCALLSGAILFLTALLPTTNFAATTLKFGAVAPEGTTWGNALKALAQEVETKTNKEVQFKIYYGAAQGDEPVILRKIRTGQMHGGIFTGRALGDINSEVRIMEVPFTFKEKREKALQILTQHADFFNKGFAAKQFYNFGFFETGPVYMVMTKKRSSFKELQGTKIWSWDGDPLSTTLFQNMSLVSVPLALPDVLPSLSTGIIDATYGPPMGILAMQWNTKTKYLIDFPVTYSMGAFLISHKGQKMIPAKYQKLVAEICTRHINRANEITVKENREALDALKLSGIEFIKLPATDIAATDQIREKVMAQLKGKMFSEATLQFIKSKI